MSCRFSAGSATVFFLSSHRSWPSRHTSPHVAAFSQVKAERHVDEEATIEDLQHKTVKHIKEEHHEEEVIQDPSKAGKNAQ